ncbi:MAG: cupredoxin domain-containing protein [Gemmatimonadaceae bacterium]
MTTTDWIVVAAGAALIGWVYWYFFVAPRVAVSMPAPDMVGMPEITITVKGGYEPAQIRVKSGQPVRLTFDRQETSSCSEEIVFPDFGVKKFLPAFEKTTIELTPPRPGKYGFMCGMSMLHGSLIAE